MELMETEPRKLGTEREMEKGENKAAYDAIQKTKWSKYRYATIVIPGNGPVLTTTPVSPDNKIHCAVAAMRYKNNWAPFIIVTGGYCYPFQGPYCVCNLRARKTIIAKGTAAYWFARNNPVLYEISLT